MPHWNGVINTGSPAILEGCEGDPERVLEKLREEAPKGTSVLGIRWISGEDRATVTAAGPTAEEFLRKTLEATDLMEDLSANERKRQKG
jgi:hypothetical protein